jgi:hypothetical protein
VRATLATPAAGARNPVGADARCAAASLLLTKWGPASRALERQNRDGAWRTWNAGERLATRAVGTRSAEIRRVMHASCTPGWESRNIENRRANAND